ncbi:hypothetical protein ABT051_42265, partial [Streptomyces sp. NPDC002769]
MPRPARREAARGAARTRVVLGPAGVRGGAAAYGDVVVRILCVRVDIPAPVVHGAPAGGGQREGWARVAVSGDLGKGRPYQPSTTCGPDRPRPSIIR